MTLYILVTGDNVISGVYNSKDKLLAEMTSLFAGDTLNRVEMWDLNKGYIGLLNITKTTTIRITD
jgi:hypothetical protein